VSTLWHWTGIALEWAIALCLLILAVLFAFTAACMLAGSVLHWRNQRQQDRDFEAHERDALELGELTGQDRAEIAWLKALYAAESTEERP